MIRAGAVGFLNARPLVQGLAQHPLFDDLRFDVPSVCARLLHEGDIDLGLIPTIELLRGPVTYDIVPGLAIGSRGPVRSVALFTRRPLASIARVALDVSSRSSAALLQLLCRHHFGIDPDFVDAAPNLAAMLEVADAVLLIGDPALHAPWETLHVEKIDLGAAWRAMTGLPFVFAVWAARPGALTPAITAALHEARRAGERAIPVIAQAEAGGDAARAGTLEQYLRHNIRYDLDGEALMGLERYLALAMDDGLAPARWDVLQMLAACRSAAETLH